MKIDYLANENFIIYLNKYHLKDLKLDQKKNVEDYFKKLFKKINNLYQLKIEGYYNVKVYENPLYGLIIEVDKLCNEYFSICGNKVDMKIIFKFNSPFLYEVEDFFILDNLKDSIKNIYYHHRYYIELKNEIDDKLYNFLLENSHIVYNDKVQDILIQSLKLLQP